MTNPSKDYGIGLQTIDEIKNRSKLTNFARNCDNNVGNSDCTIMKDWWESQKKRNH
jgi:hypothetical protein